MEDYVIRKLLDVINIHLQGYVKVVILSLILLMGIVFLEDQDQIKLVNIHGHKVHQVTVLFLDVNYHLNMVV